MIFVVLCCIWGCRTSEKRGAETVIRVDLEKMHKVNLFGEDMNRICLTDSGRFVLLDDVKKILSVKDQYVIQSKNNVFAFDAQTGARKMSFSNQGRAQGEFIHLWDVWIEAEQLCMYDMNGKKILYYDLNGVFSKSISVSDKASSNPFQVLAMLRDDCYVGKCVYSGMEASELALYDRNFEFVKEIGDLKIESGIYLGYPFFVYTPNEVLYYRYLYNDIYAIDAKQNVTVKYYVDFGEHNVPLDPNLKDEYDRIDFVNKHGNKYATLVSNIYESDQYFCFRFVFDGKKCLGVYDKSSGKTAAFTFDTLSELPVTDVYVFENKALLLSQGMDKVCLITVSVDDLLKNI